MSTFLRKRTIIAGALYLITAHTHAFNREISTCDYANMDGETVEILPLNSLAHFNQHNKKSPTTYRYIYNDKYLQSNVVTNKYHGRVGKLQINDHSSIKGRSVNGLPKSTVRVHKLTLSNCENIYVGYSESDPVFSEYFAIDNDNSTGKMNWLLSFNDFSLVSTGAVDRLIANKGVEYVIMPLHGADSMYATSVHGNEHVSLPAYSTVTLIGVERRPFQLYVDNKSFSSNLTLRVLLDNVEYFIGWEPERFYTKSAVTDYFVRYVDKEHVNAVKRGEYSRGFTSNEVALSLGKPSYIKTQLAIENLKYGRMHVLPIGYQLKEQEGASNFQVKQYLENPDDYVIHYGFVENYFYPDLNLQLVFNQLNLLVDIRKLN